ncbi:acetyl-CoA acetyltransferase [Catellatospora sp. IY07-71]|uniref:acetyl-CoA C-acetyltransferase n=1 Tax=Catellatospora sp. IY07-71 TaxID=2728827 RepID=UPI001BB305FD|nr:acetyl-CoA C-acetyltransferase [Catellatospora sp. IY07-71]BCJ71930.1 acetyl-CoA acetyltransferase [Catellatospora sp. IY07-71]
MTQSVRKVAVLGGNRIPFARSNSKYAQASNQDMLTAALDGLIARYGLSGQRLGEVAAGAVLKHARDFNLTRESVLGTGLDPATPAVDLQQACGTGLQAITYLANKIALGQLESGIAGGVDTTSDAPLQLNEQFRRVLLRLNSAKSTGDRLKAALALRPLQPFKPELPRNAEPRTGLSMGEHAAITAERWGVTRADQDELALDSHRKLGAAYEAGFFDDLLTPYLGLTRDQNLRPDTSLEKLGSLKPVYGLRGKNPTMTAGNSTPLTDGAAVVLLGSEEWAAEHSLPVLAHFVTAQTAAVDFVHGDPEPEGLLMAPVYAVPQLLSRLGLKLQDFDFYEIHEAFASQVLATLAAWESNGLGTIDRSRLNVNGSSLAAGHPFAATGGRIVATAAKLLAQRGSGRALISICAAGGQGVVAVLER